MKVRLLPRLPGPHWGLGRHVEHDERSRAYSVARAAAIATVQHESQLAVFDQGGLGSCTGQAAVGCLGYEPFRSSLPTVELNGDVAVAVYSDATELDSFPGSWPPDDTGSSGLAAAKALQLRGWISGYLHAFSFADTLGALMARPLIIGTNWYDRMFYPYLDGRVEIGGPVVGGHEYILDGWDETRGVAFFRNSWGSDWGRAGSFSMSGETLSRLLNEEGDAIQFMPVDQPAPQPVEPDQPGGCLAWMLGFRRSFRRSS